MLAITFMLRIFAIIYESIFLFVGLALLIPGLCISAMTFFATSNGAEASGPGMVMGPPMAGLGLLLLVPMIWARSLRTLSPEGIWPMIGIFIANGVFLWGRKFFALISHPAVLAFCNMSDQIVNAVIIFNLAAVILLASFDSSVTMRSLASKRTEFYIKPEDKILGLAATLIGLVFLTCWILAHWKKH